MKLWRRSEDNNKQEDSQYESSFNIIAAATSSTTTAYVTNLVHYGVIARQVHSAFGRATGSCGGEVPQGGGVRSGILIFSIASMLMNISDVSPIFGFLFVFLKLEVERRVCSRRVD